MKVPNIQHLNISLKTKLSRKTRHHTKKRKLHSQPYSLIQTNNSKLPEYPYYKTDYVLNVSKIHKLVEKLPSLVTISHNTPIAHNTPNKYNKYNTYKNVSKNVSKFVPLQLDDIGTNYVVIRCRWNDNLELTSLTDYFTEPCRIKCVFKKQQSPLDYWNKNYKNLINILKMRHKPVTNYNLRDAMYFRNKPCNNFRIPVCLEILRLFKPTKWLDISAGWGDRLLSALLYTPLQVYCGIDPNPCLHPYYQEMINTFNTSHKSHKSREFILIRDGFETAKLPDIMFDLVFSSPPFFDLENYSGVKEDSYTKFKTPDNWFNGFLMPSIYKAIGKLVTGGYLILYMDESHGTNYIPRMVKLLDDLQDDTKMKKLKNIGMFYYTDSTGTNTGTSINKNKYRPFYCWQNMA